MGRQRDLDLRENVETQRWKQMIIRGACTSFCSYTSKLLLIHNLYLQLEFCIFYHQPIELESFISLWIIHWSQYCSCFVIFLEVIYLPQRHIVLKTQSPVWFWNLHLNGLFIVAVCCRRFSLTFWRALGCCWLGDIQLNVPGNHKPDYL